MYLKSITSLALIVFSVTLNIGIAHADLVDDESKAIDDLSRQLELIVRCDHKNIGQKECVDGLQKLQKIYQDGLFTDDTLRYSRKIVIGTKWKRDHEATQEVPFNFDTDDLITYLKNVLPDSPSCNRRGYGFTYVDYIPGTSVTFSRGVAAGYIQLGSGQSPDSEVMVYDVLNHFAAHRAGLQNGDIVRFVNQVEIKKVDDLTQILKTQPPYNLKVERSGTIVSLTLNEREVLCDFQIYNLVEAYVNMLQ